MGATVSNGNEISEEGQNVIKFYISFSDLDEERGKYLYNGLLQRGFVPWMRKESIEEDGKMEAAIRSAIHDCNFFIVVLSRKSVSEEGYLDTNIQRDLRILWRGINNAGFLISIRFDHCGVPEDLKAFGWIDLFKESDWSRLSEVCEQVIQSRASSRLVEPQDQGTQFLSTMQPEKEPISMVDGPENYSSVSDWRIELRRLLEGGREVSLLQLGSVQEYIEVLIAEADDSEAAEDAYQQALCDIIQSWKPSILSAEYYSSHMLDLINTITPAEGFVKVLEFINMADRLDWDESRKKGQQHIEDLHMKALVVLESYYRYSPLPPIDRSSSFKTYINVLREELLHPRYSGYAARRLIELEQLDPSDEEIETVVVSTPEALFEIFKLVLDSNRRSSVAIHIASIYAHCLKAGGDVDIFFNHALSAYGAELRHESQNPILYFSNGECIAINLSDNIQDLYMLHRWKYGESNGLAEYKRIPAGGSFEDN